MLPTMLLVAGLASGSTALESPAPELLDMARRTHACATARGETTSNVITLIDFSRPSTEKRLWVVDLETNQTLFHELVSHGKNSGPNTPVQFSNRPQSNQSSLGVFRTAETYRGKHGRSLRLDGLEPGFNDNARRRAIVIHSANYVSESFAQRRGRLGRSQGCPALPEHSAQQIIDAIAGGSLMIAYYPDQAWLARSEYMQCTPPDDQVFASARSSRASTP